MFTLKAPTVAYATPALLQAIVQLDSPAANVFTKGPTLDSRSGRARDVN